MRCSSSLLRFCVCSFLGIAAGQCAQAQSLKIDYTGSLYGYYRMEAWEATPVLPPVDRFLQARTQQSGNLLLGMGDNFGPEFGAALQMEDGIDTAHDPYGCYLAPTDRKNGETRPETLYKDDNRVPRAAKCDSVLNFMMKAGYRAVVPGREDFMYTSRWLRVSALLLKQASVRATEIQNPDHKLFLLGANLRIESAKGQQGTSDDNAAKQTGKGDASSGNKYSLQGHCPLLFADAPFGPDATPCYSAGQPAALEYLERLDRLEEGHGENITAKALERLAQQSAEANAGHQSELISLMQDQVNIFFSAWGRLDAVAKLHKPLLPLPKTMDGNGHSDLAIEKQIEGLNQLKATCEAPDSSTADMCTYWKELVARLTNLKKSLADHKLELSYVLTDDAREAAIRGLLLTIAQEQQDAGYTLTGGNGSPRVLVVGVAGIETMNAISQINLDLCPGAAPVGTQVDTFTTCEGVDHPKAKVTVTDPVAIVAAIVRAVEMREGHVDGVVVLAQMTHTEAEVLSARVTRRLRSVTTPQTVQPVDLVLSEAEEAYSTPNVTLNYDSATAAQMPRTSPVFTPLKSYSSNKSSFPGTVYEASITNIAGKSYALSNRIDTSSDLPPGENKVTIANCFIKLVDQLKVSISAEPASCDDNAPVGLTQAQLKEVKDTIAGNEKERASREELLLFELLQKAAKPRPDVVLLESRDLQLDSIDPAYAGYNRVCEKEEPTPQQPHAQQLCRLRIALDRIFWKGDYLEFVAVKGTDLRSMIEISNKKMDDRTELVDRDITGEWLVTYGVVQSTLKNVTEVSRNNEPLWIPVDNNCKGPTPQASVYCVGGSPLVDDQYYWVLTSDHLAQDAQVYGTLQKLPEIEHATSRKFLTMPLAHYLLASLEDSKTRPGIMTVASICDSVECDVTTRNAQVQQIPLWQMDFLKVVANFTSRSPVGGNQFVGSYFQGVSDARASAPSQQELDLEFANRITGDLLSTFDRENKPSRFSEGVQTSFGYDRSVVGNLSPSTKPINASYSLNNLTVGGFIQVRLDGKNDRGLPPSVRSLPRTLLVLTPYQYQLQVNHQYLFFPFAASSPLPGELSVTVPRNTSWTDRVGLRREYVSTSKHSLLTGSFIEAGGEYITQNNVLSGITLANGNTRKTCLVNANITLQTCFSQPHAFPITSNTQLVQPVLVKDLHSPGLYWNLHLENRLFSKVSLVTDAQGDFYFGRPASAELPTQTEYAVPLSLSLVFPAFGNLSFAPTYSGFFYKSQLSSESLQVNSFSIAARWYLARDNRVPVVRQSKLPGPQSSDQTKTAKAH